MWVDVQTNRERFDIDTVTKSLGTPYNLNGTFKLGSRSDVKFGYINLKDPTFDP